MLLADGRILFNQYFVGVEMFGKRLRANLRSVQSDLYTLRQEPVFVP
jgi:hypothetical protein